MDLTEQFFACPYCNAEISVLLDPSVPAQAYIEDCEVCCRPLEIRYQIDEGELVEFSAEAVEQ